MPGVMASIGNGFAIIKSRGHPILGIITLDCQARLSGFFTPESVALALYSFNDVVQLGRAVWILPLRVSPGLLFPELSDCRACRRCEAQGMPL